jgi:hypothetical protein
MSDPNTAAWNRLKEICETATSVVGLRLELDSERPTAAGWTVFAGAEKWARSENPADLGEALGPVESALRRLAEAGDADATSLLARFPGQDASTVA